MQLDLGSCGVRSFRETDAAELARHANNRDVWRQLRDRFPHPYTIDDARGFITFAGGADPETAFAVTVDDLPVGSIGAVLGEDVERCSAEVGYWLGETHWGRGIATRALVGFTQYAFAAYDLERLFAVPLAGNTVGCWRRPVAGSRAACGGAPSKTVSFRTSCCMPFCAGMERRLRIADSSVKRVCSSARDVADRAPQAQRPSRQWSGSRSRTENAGEQRAGSRPVPWGTRLDYLRFATAYVPRLRRTRCRAPGAGPRTNAELPVPRLRPRSGSGRSGSPVTLKAPSYRFPRDR